MIKKIRQQQQNVNDSCRDCGSVVDIGAVIDEHDTELVLVFKTETAQADAQNMIVKAQNRFDQVNVKVNQLGYEVELILAFSVTVEKMLFQLENGL
ncbi:DUF406 family protein [Shewanella sp. OMA3-2]|uniref:DUF406 family protein n=1 Tax=Shewanella sp. OMA3-2 TaxID=2908650 RepID=UPI001F387DBF|nr:DUF406 family protein [Shewanella sp. OMA3-2]UJF20903.1 YfcZ/YiiS family protein [Shewanella sp. OMA3-2]